MLSGRLLLRALLTALVLGTGTDCLFGLGYDCKVGDLRCTETQIESCDATETSSQWVPAGTCDPGTRCVPGTTICALSASPDPRCRSGDGWSCDGNSIFACEKGYLTAESVCGDGQTCTYTSTDPGAVCTPPDPSCEPFAYESFYCRGNDIVKCEYGHRVMRATCGTAAASGIGYSATRAGIATYTACVGYGEAACLPTARSAAVRCPDAGAGLVCDGSTELDCVIGYAVGRRSCRSCADTAPGGHGPVCTGYLGGPCTTTDDCAAGLTCRAETNGLTCSIACSADDTCAAAAPDVGSLLAPAAPLRCVGGWCE